MDRPGPVGTAHAVVLGLGAVHVGARLLGARRTAVATKPLIGPALAALAAVSVRGTRSVPRGR